VEFAVDSQQGTIEKVDTWYSPEQDYRGVICKLRMSFLTVPKIKVTHRFMPF
jgi:hypothetical protein